MPHSKGPFTLTENSWSDTSLYDGDGRRVALLSIQYDCDENSQDEWEKRQAADAAVMADALNVHEATGLTPSQLQARVAELEAARVTQDRILRSSVPERWKGCTSPVGSAQSYIAELEQALMRVRQEAVADDMDDWFRAAGEAIEP